VFEDLQRKEGGKNLPMDDEIVVAKVDEIFKRHDKDATGFLDMAELPKALKALVPKSMLECDVNRFFEELIKISDDGLLSKKDLMTYLSGGEQVQKSLAEAIRTHADEVRLKKVRVLFRMYDKTDDGFLTMGELTKLIKALGPDFTGAEIQAIEADIDKIKDGKVSTDELMEWVSSHSEVARELRKVIDRTTGGVRTARIKATFQKYDKSGDGNLEIPELHVALHNLGCFTTEEVKRVCTDLDKNRDGMVSFKEFSAWVSSGSGTKEVTKAKAILAPTDSDGLEAVFYNFCGPGHLDMDHGAFLKMCRDCNWEDERSDEHTLDLIFNKLKHRSTQRIEFEQFEELRDLLAQKRGADHEEIYDALIRTWKPQVRLLNVTKTKEFELGSRPLGSSTPRSPRKPKTPRRALGVTRLPVIKTPRSLDNTELYKVFGMNTPAGRALLRCYPPKESPRSPVSSPLSSQRGGRTF
jgi:Ca2+-binding EF-hand superfamily protein